MNKERLLSIIRDIERFFCDLDSIKVRKIEDLASKERFYAASMLLFSLINRAIDLGEEIVADKKLGLPGTYREIFYLLSKHKVISRELSDDLSSLVYFRNLAAHEYQTFTESDVYSAFHKIKSVQRFVDVVKNRLGLTAA